MSTTSKINYDYITYKTHCSNGGDCNQLNICGKILENNFNINNKYLNNNFDKCFCCKCRANKHNGNKKGLVFQRGGGIYIIPEGWSRICLLIDKEYCNKNNVLQCWHPAYHGTTKENVEKIINGGLKFLIPGDTKPNGNKHGIRTDCCRIRKVFKRYNKYYKKEEIFDPKQIFTSPSIIYSSFYAPDFICQHPYNLNKKLKVKFVFQIRQKPNSFKIGQETMGYGDTKISKYIQNDRIEYYTKNNGKEYFLVNGLLIKYTIL